MKQREKVKKGTRFHRYEVQRIYQEGPFTLVDLRCTCKARTIRKHRTLGELIRGKALSCGCLNKEFRAKLHTERIKIMKRFFPQFIGKGL